MTDEHVVYLNDVYNSIISVGKLYPIHYYERDPHDCLYPVIRTGTNSELYATRHDLHILRPL